MADVVHKFKILVTKFVSVCILYLLSSQNIYAADIQVFALFKDMAIIKIDGRQHKLKTGQSSPEGVKLISADSEKAVLEINGQQKSYKLGSQTRFNSVQRTQGEARIWRKQGMFMTTGTINDQPVNFMVDTGATWIAMDYVTARRLSINYTHGGSKGWVSTANGNTPAYKVLLNKVNLVHLLCL